MKTFTTGVFERSGRDTLSDNVFYLILTLSLIWGFCCTAIAANMSVESGFTPNVWQIIGIGLVIPVVGIFISIGSENPILSFIGYNMVLIPMGIILGPVVNQYSPDSVRNALLLTGGITFFMGFMGTCFPRLFANLGTVLFMSLVGLVLLRAAQLFIPEMATFTWIDYLSAGIFSLYIGFDMYRAQEMPKTFDNAIDLSVDLYLDILNLFINILKIMGEAKK